MLIEEGRSSQSVADLFNAGRFTVYGTGRSPIVLK
jgi:hypothetical protein